MKERMFIIPEDELVDLIAAKYERDFFLDSCGNSYWINHPAWRDSFTASILKRERPELYQEYKHNGDDFYCYHFDDVAQDTLYEFCKEHDIKEEGVN